MTTMITAISTAIAAFIATNLDDILILTILFTQVNKLFRRRHIVIGQYLGFILLILASLTGFFGSFLIPAQWIRFLGLLPVIFGIRSLWQREETETDNNVEVAVESAPYFPLAAWFSPQTGAVAAITCLVFYCSSVNPITGDR